jgi:hypothetical protein
MKKQDLFLFLFLITITFSVFVYLFSHRIKIHYESDPISNALIEMKNPLDVLKFNVIKGHEFEVILKDGRNIHAFLDVESVKGSEKQVIDLLANCSNPKIILKNKYDNYWKVQIYITTKDSNNTNIQVDLSEWLRQKNLIYN